MTILRASMAGALVGVLLPLLYLSTQWAFPPDYKVHGETVALALWPTMVALLMPQPPVALYVAAVAANSLLYAFLGNL